MSDVKEKVLKEMENAGKPLRPGDIAKALSLDSKEVSKVVKELKAEGKIISPKRCFYAPTN
ncbi:MAG: transcriptional regulator [Acidobacteria bacterium]|nr:transcriptional regulator [Acidobacteriota bacterium]